MLSIYLTIHNRKNWNHLQQCLQWDENRDFGMFGCMELLQSTVKTFSSGCSDQDALEYKIFIHVSNFYSHYSLCATNLSNSIKRRRWSLSRKSEPLSSNFGARKTLTMPSRCAPESLFTWIVIVYGSCCKWVNLCIKRSELIAPYVMKMKKSSLNIYLAKTSPLGTKSIPNQK